MKPNTLIDLLFQFALASVRSGNKRIRQGRPVRWKAVPEMKEAEGFAISCPGRTCLASPLLSAVLRRSPPVRRKPERTDGDRPPGAECKAGRSGHHESGACHRAGCTPCPVLCAGERWRTHPTSRRVREPLRRAAYFFQAGRSGAPARGRSLRVVQALVSPPFEPLIACRPRGTDSPVSCAFPYMARKCLWTSV